MANYWNKPIFSLNELLYQGDLETELDDEEQQSLKKSIWLILKLKLLG